jgi:ATP-binding cassette, subfamily B (MDR/TAP), member 1
VIFAIVLAATSLMPIAFQVMTITKAATAAAELFHVIDKKSDIDPMSEEGAAPVSCNGHIEFRDVAFEYPSRPDTQVLKAFTLDVPANKTTALVGASGSGKSTAVALLERWYDPSGGEILFDGSDLRKLKVRWLRQTVQLVQQEPVLFSGTIFDNVAYGLIGTKQEDASGQHKLELVKDACKAAFAHDFIQQLPNQYDTQIGERARTLSGGQRQRIAIARSIISNPRVLLLDEATSALDPNAEKIVQEALDNVSRSRTTIMIAHKLSTVQKADNIAVMSQGAVIEQGTHHELFIRNGAYARLVRAQNLQQAADYADSSAENGPLPYDEDGKSNHGDEIHKVKTNTSTTRDGRLLDDESKDSSAEDMGYGLIKCLYLLISEQPQLWIYYFGLGLVSLCAGKQLPFEKEYGADVL